MIDHFTAWFQALSLAEQAFFALGLCSNLLFALYVLFQHWGDHDQDLPLSHTDLDVAVFGFRGLLAFGMFLGWAAFLALRNGWSLPAALLIGIFAGGLAAWLAWKLVQLLLRLQSSGTLDLEQSYGKTGVAYLPIPKAGEGKGKVIITLQGAQRELEAVSEDDAIPTGQSVEVVGLAPGGVLIVRIYD